MAKTTPYGLEWGRNRILPWSELTFRSDTSGGPGGQHANRSATRVSLLWLPSRSSAFTDAERERVLQHLAPRLSNSGWLRIRSGRERSLARNKEDCLDQLARWIRQALERRRPRVPTRPSSGSRERRLSAKHQRSRVKEGRRRIRDEP